MAGEPTLHYGDQSADGWVEYAQGLLLGVAPDLVGDGIFGDHTINAVYTFQQQNGLMVDGVIGNQTWSVLRGGEQAAVGTDGHQHQATDATMHATFYTDQSPQGQNGEYWETDDALTFIVAVVGSLPIPSHEYNIWVNIENDEHMLHSAKVPLEEIGGKPEAAGRRPDVGTGQGREAVAGRQWSLHV